MTASDYPTLVLASNRDGMESLRGGELKAAFEHFKFAESILLANPNDSSSNSLLAVTCKNLGCYYKKTGKLHGALSYLRKALKIEEDLGAKEDTLAGTHLNICAILSKLQKHDKAVQHALSALDLIKARIEACEEAQEPVSQDDYSVLAIAYHNIAVERDLLEEFPESAAAYRQGHEVAERFLGEAHPLTMTLGQNSAELQIKCHKKTPALLAASRSKAKARGAWSGTRDGSSMLPKIPLTPTSVVNDAEVTLPQAALRDEDASWTQTTALAADFLPALIEPADQKSDLLMDIVEADTTKSLAITNARIQPNDCRPNRVIKGANRAARVVRRTGTLKSTKHRDQVMTGLPGGASASQRTAHTRRLAAERIQRTWRSWFKYCQDHHETMVSTYMAAVMIQSRWRSYHVRRQRFDKAAVHIQQRARGMLLRQVLRKYRAAVTIQRRGRGMNARRRIKRMTVAAIKIQALARGAAGRRAVRAKRRLNAKMALRIQCAVRRMIARRVVGERRAIVKAEAKRQRAIIDVQRLVRGFLGRRRFWRFHAIRARSIDEGRAATKLQAMARRDQAIKRVDTKRAELLARMHVAATLIRKIYVGFHTRSMYRQYLAEFRSREDQVRTMQRYGRGFLVRLRMWREATRAEEELWAATEIQRVWRGYLGRVRLEGKFEMLWRRETAAMRIQRNIRGFIVRSKISRLRRRIAREEFDRARKRFRAAQRMQALCRGVLTRKVTSARWHQKVHAATEIQRIWHGHRLREALWAQILELRATLIQSNIRGFLTRNRFYKLIALVICIQRSWKRWQEKPEAFRQEQFEAMRIRKKSAVIIQKSLKKQRTLPTAEGDPVGVE